MTRVLIILAVLGTASSFLHAQTPRISAIKKGEYPESILACPPGQENDAGTISLGPFNGQSNDVDFDTMFLCFGDQILIDHDAGSENLSGDPDPATTPGVGYAFYTCEPTVDGPDLTAITNDPCTLNDPPLPPGFLYIATGGNTNGDVLFENTGLIQAFFDPVDTMPATVWFAPITYDDLVDSVAFYEGNPSGQCVNVSTDEAFAVVYLNEIEISNVNTSANGSSCQGNFTITGGLPEVDGSNYDVSMTLDSDPSIEAFLQGLIPTHGGTQNFKIFVPGVYNVVISDGKGCERTFQIDMAGCDAIGIEITEQFGQSGDNVCVSFIATNFIDIQSFQFTIEFDTSVILFSNNSFQNTLLTEGGISPVSFGPADPNGSAEITVNWFDLNFNGQTVPDGTVLFDLCFDINGDPGDVADLAIEFAPVNVSTPLEVKKALDPLTFVDAGLVSNPGSVTVFDPSTLLVDITKEDVTCKNADNGSFTMTVSGGNPIYEIVYQLTGGGGNFGPDTIFVDGGSFTADNLAPGTYIIITNDQSFPVPLVATDTVVITEPLFQLGVGPDIMGFQNVLCNGDSSGAFPIQVFGGTPPYSFLWSNGDTTQNIDNLVADSYVVTVTDANGCMAQASATIGEPAPITTNLGSFDATCSGTDDGTAFVAASGGTVLNNYSYEWSSVPAQFADTINGLDVGMYFVTVTDDNNCEMVDSVMVGAATIIQANAIANNISCFGENDGSILLNPSAIGIENGNYFYSWDPLVGGVLDDEVTDLSPGSVSVTITDGLGCNIDTTITIEEPPVLDVMVVNTQDESCIAGADGFIVVSASGGTLAMGADYTYDWGNVQTDSIFGLPAGSYTVTVSDDNGCIDSVTQVIDPPNAPIINMFDITPPTCFNSMNGEVSVDITPGGAPIQTIEWSNSSTGNTISNLGAGEYIVTITADDGCVTSDTAVVIAPDSISIANATLELPSCAGDEDGFILLSLEGGTTPYTITWSNGPTTENNFNIGAGIYTITVIDANFCPPFTQDIELQDPSPLEAAVDPASITGVSCFGQIPCDGQATATASGGGAGTGMYTYNWSSDFTEFGDVSTATNVCQGDQFVEVSDANGCIDTAFFNVPNPLPIGINALLSDTTDVTCNGDSDGSAIIVGTGGTPDPVNGYDYLWIGLGVTTSEVQNLQPNLNGYPVQITDANGCSSTFLIPIDEPDPIVVEAVSVQDVECPGDENGQIEVNRTGGNPGPTSYSWSGNVGSGPVVTDLSAGIYFVTATDPLGCEGVGQFGITEPDPIVVKLDSIVPIVCNGLPTTILLDTVFGGNGGPYFLTNGRVPPITYPIRNIIDRFFGGENFIEVVDANGCIADTTFFINEPPQILVEIDPSVDLGPDSEIELGDSLVLEADLLQVFQPIVEVIWTPFFDEEGPIFPDGDSLSIRVKPLSSTTYTVTVIDENGCTGTDEIRINIDRNRNVYIPNIFSPNDDSRNDFFEVSTGAGVEIVNFMQVYSRWGELVFEATDFLPELNSNVQWDGTFKGDEMDPGVFVYLIEVTFVDGTTLLYRGTVTLVR